MGSFTKLGNEIWRYFTTDGVPASGPWKVRKSDMITWMTEVENQVGDAGRIGISADYVVQPGDKHEEGGAASVGSRHPLTILERSLKNA